MTELVGKPGGTGRMRIVIAEDDAMIRNLLCSVLRRAGYDPHAAGTGAEAIALCRELRPALVVLDGMLPDIDGREVAARLKGAIDTQRIPVLLASALDEIEAHGVGNAPAWDASLRKPFTPADLIAKVEELIAGRIPESFSPPTSGPATPVTGIAREMRKGYAEALRESVARMEAELARTTPSDQTGSLLEGLRTRLHQIGGSAATFGFARIGEIAAQAEAVVRDWQGRDPTANTSDLDQLRSAIGRIGALLRETVTTPVGYDAPAHGRSQVPPQIRTAASRLLLLHNDTAFMKSAARAALKLGYEVETNDSPLTTIERLREARFSTIVVGGQPALQPDCEWVRSMRQAGADAAILLIGGDGSTEHRITAARAGVDRYLAGQPSVEELVAEWQDLEATNAARIGRVLAVDDDPATLAFVDGVLRSSGCEVVCVSDGGNLFDDLERCDPDLLLLDVDMPSASGLDLTRAVRASVRWGKLPIVIQTAHTDAECRLRAFENGADDFISKPLLEEELRARVLTRLERERIKRDLVGTDPVTRFHGRERFLAAASDALGRCGGAVLAVIELLGLDRFTRRYGLEAADAALAAVAAGLRSSFRSARDLTARVAGDVFALLVLETDVRVVATRLELCCARLDYDPRLRPGGHPADGIRLEVSVTGLSADGDVGSALLAAVCGSRASARTRVRVAEVAASSAPVVYLIEDDEHLREMIAYALNTAGYEVKTYRSGSEGLHALVAAPIDSTENERPVVLLDIELPDIDGFRVLDEIATARPGRYRVVLLTGRSNPGDRVRGLRGGAVEFVCKPVKIPTLLAAVQGSTGASPSIGV